MFQLDLKENAKPYFENLDCANDTYTSFIQFYEITENDSGPFHGENKRLSIYDSCIIAELLYRTDFFPGLGWMLEKKTWVGIEDKWPKT